MVPGSDGVGTLPDGQRVYFAFPRAPYGSMAEQTVVRRDYCTPVPDGIDDVTAAALANPGMSSWAALTERAHFQPGQTVLINGATGASGQLAIQIARALGVGKIIATGRNEQVLGTLKALGADILIPLGDLTDPAARTDLTRVFDAAIVEHRVGVVLDYLWGPSAECLIAAVSSRHSEDGEAQPRLRLVQIGNLSGVTITLPAGALRSSGLELLGSGLGSVSNARLVAIVGELLRVAGAAKTGAGNFAINAQAVPLTEVETAWNAGGAERVVFTL